MFEYKFRWTPVLNALPDLLAGALVTLQLAVVSMVVGALLGILLALAKDATGRPLRYAAQTWISIARNTPALFQVYMVYFGLGAFGIRIDSYPALLLGITFVNAGYLAEIFRGGFRAVPPNQKLAGLSLGMSAVQTFAYVTLPQTLRAVFYPITNQIVWSILMTSLGVVVGLTTDLTGVTQAYNMKSFRTFEFFLVAGVMYYVMAKLVILAARLCAWRLFRY